MIVFHVQIDGEFEGRSSKNKPMLYDFFSSKKNKKNSHLKPNTNQPGNLSHIPFGAKTNIWRENQH